MRNDRPPADPPRARRPPAEEERDTLAENTDDATLRLGRRLEEENDPSSDRG